jgi:tetratricopeptide (TPR) repeat protein
MLKNFEEAEASYRRAISLRPDDEEIYFAFSKMYVENNQLSRAIEVIEEGLSANPDSVVLNIYLATTYLENGDYRQAEIFLERAERIDPESEVALIFRNVLRLVKLEQGPRINKLNRPKPKKKRR